jgi:hypothetical protein
MTIVDQHQAFICPRVASCLYPLCVKIFRISLPHNPNKVEHLNWCPPKPDCPKQGLPLDSMVVIMEEKPV